MATLNEDNLKFVIQRIDANIANTNTKSTLLLGINTFIIGGYASNYSYLKQITQLSFCTRLLVIISIVGIIVSSLLSIMAIVPMFKPRGSSVKKKSGIFFGSISDMSKEDYKKYVEANEYDFLDDMYNQIVEVSKISVEKHTDLIKAIYTLVILVGVPWILIGIGLFSGGAL